MPFRLPRDEASLASRSSSAATLRRRERLELIRPRAQLNSKRARQPAIRGDERLLGPPERAQVVRSGVADRRVQRRRLSDHEPKKRVARNLEDLGPSVRALRGNSLEA